MDTSTLLSTFHKVFQKNATLIVASPGRINLIGEHLDYNGGLVLPAAIDKHLLVSVAKRIDKSIHLFSIDTNQKYQIERKNNDDQLSTSNMGWPDFVIGVVDQLLKAGKGVGGFDMAITGNIPLGAGVSSSAAFECAVIFGLNELFQLSLNKIDLVLLAQKAENEFVGVQCGIMDQFASVFGKKNQVIKLNCTSLQYEYVPFKTSNTKLVLFDTHVKHSLASSAYNQRRKECEIGLSLIKANNPLVECLADASIQMVNDCIPAKLVEVKQRCTYVVEESERIKKACIDLSNNNLISFGKKMYATHEGLRKQYEVSCEELDFIVDECKRYPEVLGARMMGGGFGGCVLALINIDSIESISLHIGLAYHEKFTIEMGMFEVLIEDGTKIIYQH
ncbi:MAG: galactokinase [Sphingobacteriia bacterium]|jgi:galactokinase